MTTLPLLLSVLLAAPSGQSGRLDPARVSDEAAWILHVDLEALSRSALLGGLHENGIHLENEFDLDRVRSELGLDPWKDLRSLTFSGLGARGAESACIARGTPALAEAWRRLATSGASPVAIAGLEALQAGGPRKGIFFALLPVAEAAERVAVVAPSEGALRTAYLAAQGEAPTLAHPRADRVGASRGTLTARPGSGSLVFAACKPVARAQDDAVFLARSIGLLAELAVLPREHARELVLCTRALEFELSESNGQLELRLALETGSPSEATRVEVLLREAVAAASAHARGAQASEGVRQLLAGLQMERSGARFVARYRYSASRFATDVCRLERAGAEGAGG